MKKSVVLSLFCVVLLTACNISVNSSGWSLEPSGNIVKKEYKQTAFDKIDIDAAANVKIIQSTDSDYRVVLSAPENYVDIFNFEVNKHELNVEFKKTQMNIDVKNVDITIYVPHLHKLENDGIANIEIDSFRSDELKVENDGVGSMFLSALQIAHLEVDCGGVGSMELSGEAERAELDCSGVGSIKAEKLKAKSVKARVSGVGGISCYASQSIDGDVSGVGSLNYAGKPEQKQLSRSGVGDIVEL